MEVAVNLFKGITLFHVSKKLENYNRIKYILWTTQKTTNIRLFGIPFCFALHRELF